MNQTVINKIYPKLIPEIAKQANIDGAYIVDLFGRMGGKDLSMLDGCHPNK
jgi:hypothetical protein